MEDSEHVVFRAKMVDWVLADDPNIGFDDLPLNRRSVFDLLLEQYGSQFRLVMKREDVNASNFQGTCILDMLLEINAGVPCVHMTNDPADTQLVTVFGTEHGLLVRPDDGEWARADSGCIPEVLQTLADEVCGETERHKSYVALMDTAKKYRDDPYVSATTVDSGIPVINVSCVTAPPEDFRGTPVVLPELPHARTDLVTPVTRQLVGSYVQVKFERHYSFEDVCLRIHVDLTDSQGVVGEFDHVEFNTKYPLHAPLDELSALAGKLAELVAFFAEASYLMPNLTPIIQSVAEAKEPLSWATCLFDLAFFADHKYEGFAAVRKAVQNG